jgi:hypothetical protein
MSCFIQYAPYHLRRKIGTPRRAPGDTVQATLNRSPSRASATCPAAEVRTPPTSSARSASWRATSSPASSWRPRCSSPPGPRLVAVPDPDDGYYQCTGDPSGGRGMGAPQAGGRSDLRIAPARRARLTDGRALARPIEGATSDPWTLALTPAQGDLRDRARRFVVEELQPRRRPLSQPADESRRRQCQFSNGRSPPARRRASHPPTAAWLVGPRAGPRPRERFGQSTGGLTLVPDAYNKKPSTATSHSARY